MIRFLACVGFLLACAQLSACSWWDNTETKHKVKCNQLKSYIIFNGGTSNIRRADIQRAETPLAQSNYNADCE